MWKFTFLISFTLMLNIYFCKTILSGVSQGFRIGPILFKRQSKCYPRLELDDYESDFWNLIKNNGINTMEIKWLRTLATENFKTTNNINPSSIKNILIPKTNAKIWPHDIIVRHHNTATYRDKRLTALGRKIQNKRPVNTRSLTSIKKIKKYIRTQFGPAVMLILFWEFLMVWLIFLSPQAKRNVIINNKLVYTSCLMIFQTT